MADSDDPDTEALAEAVVAELDTGTVVDDKIVVSRRGLTALIGAGLTTMRSRRTARTERASSTSKRNEPAD